MGWAISMTIVALAVASPVSASTRCLGPDAGRAIRDVLATGTVQRALPAGFAIENVEIGGHDITLSVRDSRQTRYGVGLQVASAPGGKFTFAIADASNPPPHDVADALLGAGRLLGDGIPDSALIDCSDGSGEPGFRGSHDPRDSGASGALTLPPVLALTSAVAEISIVVAAVLFGLATIAKRSEGGHGPAGER